MKKLKYQARRIDVAEIGVGVGTTAVAICKVLEKDDTYTCFDFEEKVISLLHDLRMLPEVSCKLVGYGNTNKNYDSYCWNLSKLIFQMRNQEKKGLFDIVYLDGAHNFPIDGLACCLLKQLLKPGGYIIFDDLKWSYAIDGPKDMIDMKKIEEGYTDEQIADCQIRRVVNLFMLNDPMFEEVDNGSCYNPPKVNPPRAMFRKNVVELPMKSIL